MWDKPLMSDQDVEEMGTRALQYRVNILYDLEGSFENAVYTSGFYGILVPISAALSLFFGWNKRGWFAGDREIWFVLLFSIATVASWSIWAFSLYWHKRFKRRLAIAESALDRAEDDN